MKKCSKCQEVQDSAQFYMVKYGLESWCKECKHEYTTAYKKRNPDKHAKWQRTTKLRKLYGITDDEYESMMIEQGNKCALCQIEMEKLCIDHCHDTNKVRGLLCHKCNSGLGHFNDNIELVKKSNKLFS